MQVCISLQIDNHASTPPLKFFTGRMPFLPPNQQRQSTEGKTHSESNCKNILQYFFFYIDYYAQFTLLARHDKTVLSVSCLAWRCELAFTNDIAKLFSQIIAVAIGTFS